MTLGDFSDESEVGEYDVTVTGYVGDKSASAPFKMKIAKYCYSNYFNAPQAPNDQEYKSGN